MSRKDRYESKSSLTLVYLDDIAEALEIHPRTILRAITGNPTEYWAPSHNPRIHLSEVSKTYQIPTKNLVELVKEEDSVLRPDAAADALGFTVRTMRNNAKKFPPLAIGAGFLRFSVAEVEQWGKDLREERRYKASQIF